MEFGFYCLRTVHSESHFCRKWKLVGSSSVSQEAKFWRGMCLSVSNLLSLSLSLSLSVVPPPTVCRRRQVTINGRDVRLVDDAVGGSNIDNCFHACSVQPPVCLHGGLCEADMDRYECRCAPGFDGLHCEHSTCVYENCRETKL